jgi:hypothetical protein
LAFNQREISHDQLVFAVPDSAFTISLYLRVKTQGIIMVPVKLWNEEHYIQFIGSHRIFIGVFYGFMAAMGLINLFLFVTSRNVSTLLYAGDLFITTVSEWSRIGVSVLMARKYPFSKLFKLTFCVFDGIFFEFFYR